MLSVFDVAAFILEKKGTLTTMKLHKLLYYCQAWSVVWDDQPLFKEKIEAWASGPVIRELFNTHKGLYRLDSIAWGNPDTLNETQKETVMAVLDYYGHKSLQWLSDLARLEDPWNKARNGLLSDQRSHNVITLESVSEYYSSLSPDS